MTRRYVTPTVAGSFSCPHCGALSHQTWLKAYASNYKTGEFPLWEKRTDIEQIIASKKDMGPEEKIDALSFFEKMKSREPFFSEKDESYARRLMNVDFSWCYSCKKHAVWVGCRLIYPNFSHDIAPNEDMPEDIQLDFREAQSIVKFSPRGSAALLRLCIQKLCKFVGEKGKNINDDIAALVKKGLDVKIQRALDVVRVVGNDAVHPGQIDLRDDLETSEKLFTIVNVIADALITQPKLIDGLFVSIPDTKRAEITKRDG